MPHIGKATLVCYRCGTRSDVIGPRDIHNAVCDFQRGRDHDGWCEARGKVLCPGCAEGWHRLVAENDRRERDWLGIETVEFNLP